MRNGARVVCVTDGGDARDVRVVVHVNVAVHAVAGQRVVHAHNHEKGAGVRQDVGVVGNDVRRVPVVTGALQQAWRYASVGVCVA